MKYDLFTAANPAAVNQVYDAMLEYCECSLVDYVNTKLRLIEK